MIYPLQFQYLRIFCAFLRLSNSTKFCWILYCHQIAELVWKASTFTTKLGKYAACVQPQRCLYGAKVVRERNFEAEIVKLKSSIVEESLYSRSRRFLDRWINWALAANCDWTLWFFLVGLVARIPGWQISWWWWKLSNATLLFFYNYKFASQLITYKVQVTFQ